MARRTTRSHVRTGSRRSSGPKPTGVRIRMYQVGFGDCFLLTFEYDEDLDDGRRERQVLIDFGSKSLAPKHSLRSVAERVAEHSGGILDVVVVSHRHRDHMSGFGDEESAILLAGQRPPSLVVRSWTEDPAAPSDGRLPKRSAAFLESLHTARQFAGDLAAQVHEAPRSMVGDELRQLAAAQLGNDSAISQLEAWADQGSGEYVHYGQSSKIGDVVPGISVQVLGPPTIEQHPELRSQRGDDPDEFWMLYQGLLADTDAARLVRDIEPPSVGDSAPIGPAQWLIDRMGRQQANSLLRVVDALDSALNNTSLILVFEVESHEGSKRLLFGGDAQIENWEYALKFAPDAESNLDTLRQVDLYKVGHHGSRNATPRTLFNLWQEPATRDRDMVALMSTKSGVHDHSPSTAVPRATLVEALRRRMTLHSTEDFAAGADYLELMVDLSNGGTFVKVTQPR
jgi:beta-lactamase superfamily II metal-dependent hydrolase